MDLLIGWGLGVLNSDKDVGGGFFTSIRERCFGGLGRVCFLGKLVFCRSSSEVLGGLGVAFGFSCSFFILSTLSVTTTRRRVLVISTICLSPLPRVHTPWSLPSPPPPFLLQYSV